MWIWPINEKIITCTITITILDKIILQCIIIHWRIITQNNYNSKRETNANFIRASQHNNSYPLYNNSSTSNMEQVKSSYFNIQQE